MITILFDHLYDFLAKERSVGHVIYRWHVSSSTDEFIARNVTGTIYRGLLSLPKNILHREYEALMATPGWDLLIHEENYDYEFLTEMADKLWYQVRSKYFTEEKRPQRPMIAPERLTYSNQRR